MLEESSQSALFEFLVRVGDDALIAGHRLSEWCGHAPTLEEDIALTNISLDCIGTANSILGLAAETEGRGRSADDLAFFRDVREFKNALIYELPKGDFGYTILRQYLVSCYEHELFSILAQSGNSELAGISARTVKERRYHVRHCGEWVLRLGLGTEESKQRMQIALDDLWRYTDELAEQDAVIQELVTGGTIPDLQESIAIWRDKISALLEEASLSVPDEVFQQSGGRSGKHTEHLGHILDEMQIVARSHPGASW